MTDSTALDSFLDKWRSRWPEWQMAEVFVPRRQRGTALAWFALAQEFEDAMNAEGDPTPADAKLGWWREELRDWSKQRSRHPLGRVLEPQRAPWALLADALPALQRMRERPRDAAAAFAVAEPLAKAMVAVEDALFYPDQRWGTSLLGTRSQAMACHLLAARLSAAGEAAVPQELPGRNDAVLQAWADTLLRQWPPHAGEAMPRKQWSALVRLRLQGIGGGEQAALSRWRLLWSCWRAARG
jgi:hypothetical protein